MIFVQAPWIKRGSIGWNVQSNGCHEWTGGQYRGYGRTAFQGRPWSTHRLRYCLEVGPIPAGMDLDHFFCMNKICCNPAHLRPATRRENVLYNSGCEGAKNRAKTHCKHGHALTADNLIGGRPNAQGWRICKTCSKRHKRNNRERKKIYRIPASDQT